MITSRLTSWYVCRRCGPTIAVVEDVDGDLDVLPDAHLPVLRCLRCRSRRYGVWRESTDGGEP